MSNFPILTRAAAQAIGAKRYYTGVKCRNGHIAQRYVKGGMCVECLNAHRRESYNEARGAWTTFNITVPSVAVPIVKAWVMRCREAHNAGLPPPALPVEVPMPANPSIDVAAERKRLWGADVAAQMEAFDLPQPVPR